MHSLIPHQSWFLIYNVRNINEKAFNVLMTLLKILQKIVAGNFEKFPEKQRELNLQNSEIIEPLSSLFLTNVNLN